MWLTHLDREHLLKVLQGEKPKQAEGFSLESVEIPLPTRGNFVVVWRDDPRSVDDLPRLIVGNEEALDDLFAWTSAYLPGLSPFTAYCRVLSREEAKSWLHSSGRVIQTHIRNAAVGLTLAEAVCRQEGRSLAQATPVACAKTFSFVAARSLVQGMFRELNEQVYNAWISVRKLESDEEDGRLHSHLRLVWTFVAWMGELSKADFGDTGNSEDVLEMQDFLVECQKGADTPEKSWGKLTEPFPLAAGVLSEMKKTREERVKAFEKFLGQLDQVDPSNLRLPMMIGYLASRIAPGTIDHFQLLDSVRGTLPSAVLWYGVFAGIAPNTQVKSSYGGLGARLEREITRSEYPFDAPRADVSIRELVVVSRSTNWRKKIRTNAQHSMSIELLPGVSTFVSTVEPGQQTGRQNDLFRPNSSSQDVKRLQWKVDDVARAAERLKDELAKFVAGESLGQSADVGQSRRRKRK